MNMNNYQINLNPSQYVIFPRRRVRGLRTAQSILVVVVNLYVISYQTTPWEIVLSKGAAMKTKENYLHHLPTALDVQNVAQRKKWSESRFRQNAANVLAAVMVKYDQTQHIDKLLMKRNIMFSLN